MQVFFHSNLRAAPRLSFAVLVLPYVLRSWALRLGSRRSAFWRSQAAIAAL